MAILKVLRDQVVKAFYGNAYVPKGLWELENYFRQYDGIEFTFKKNDEGLVAVSENFRFGSIITSGRNQAELDRNVKDAILTSFSIPSSFAKKVIFSEKANIGNGMPSRSELPGEIKTRKFIRALRRVGFTIDMRGGDGSHFKIIWPRTEKSLTV